ncbi:hypothetical protein [Psychrobacter sp. DM8]|uniref:hypothetical protein n=1 Tax=Psychrobacter sp. DM8 TaxID=3440636 RepID=UPI003F4FAAEB
MLIPKYWAQHKQRFESKVTASQLSKQATIKRYGWSDISQSNALEHAKARVAKAHKRWLAGEDILRRERKEEYNRENGIPIREQVISEQVFPSFSQSKTASTQLIVTRNSYGAQVANVDNIAIIDVDNDDLLHHLYPDNYDSHGFIPILVTTQSVSSNKIKVWFSVFVFILIASVIAYLGLSWLWLLAFMIGVTAYLWQQANQKDKARAQKYADDKASLQPFIAGLIQKRIASYPNESFHLYETPAGFRIIATHDIIAPSAKVVTEWFTTFYADANYVRLCQAQQCFRARLTAKPWRMSEVNDKRVLDKNIPTTDFWSMPAEDVDSDENQSRYIELEARDKWIVDYDTFAKGYRACRYVESFSGRDANTQRKHETIQAFIRWHDKICQVDKELPLA